MTIGLYYFIHSSPNDPESHDLDNLLPLSTNWGAEAYCNYKVKILLSLFNVSNTKLEVLGLSDQSAEYHAYKYEKSSKLFDQV